MNIYGVLFFFHLQEVVYFFLQQYIHFESSYVEEDIILYIYFWEVLVIIALVCIIFSCMNQGGNLSISLQIKNLRGILTFWNYMFLFVPKPNLSHMAIGQNVTSKDIGVAYLRRSSLNILSNTYVSLSKHQILPSAKQFFSFFLYCTEGGGICHN